MRIKDREIQYMAEIMEILKRGSVCTVGFQDTPCPYLIPMNYGALLEEGKPALYFHGAPEGTKLELLKRDPHVSYTVFTGDRIHLDQETACRSSSSFESVCGSGTAVLLEGEEKRKGLAVLMNHLGRGEGARFNEDSFPEKEVERIAVWKIITETVTGKRHE